MNEKTIEFLGLFNDLERWFKDLLNEYGDSPRSFKSMVGIAAKKNAFIRDRAETLYDLSDLRNFLVHEFGNKVYAYPTDEAVDVLRGILGTLTGGKKLVNICGSKPVIIDASASLGRGLKLINKYDYAQLPVYDGMYFKGLLSANIITRWFAANTDEKGRINRDIDAVRISDVMQFSEAKDEAALLPRDLTVIEFYNILKDRPSRSGVYLVTPNGRHDERPLLIVTNHDIPGIMGEME